ncbi:hypothetical protein ACLBKU_13270 [Erythrobacter sp. NE805]|uniref:hypothetical protein n=1 Tax=Erythrobacter sp. NE805 TaxID=3389875 RepID=UPI00396B122A
MVDDQAPRGLAALVAAVRDASRRRKLAALGIALALEGLILVLLLTLGAKIVGDEDGKEEVTTFKSVEFAAPPDPEEQPPETSQAETPRESPPVTAPEQPARPSPLLLNPQPAPSPPPPAPPTPPQPSPTPQPQPSARPKIGARINPDRGYGPVDTGNPRTVGDSERVGTMANGEPLYAARWYREPTDQELAGYLSTANGPGVALIARRTVDGYYVEDCQLLGESPQGSQIGARGARRLVAVPGPPGADRRARAVRLLGAHPHHLFGESEAPLTAGRGPRLATGRHVVRISPLIRIGDSPGDARRHRARSTRTRGASSWNCFAGAAWRAPVCSAHRRRHWRRSGNRSSGQPSRSHPPRRRARACPSRSSRARSMRR